MTAQEMFEKLGYQKDKKEEIVITYKYGWKSISFFKQLQTIRIDLDFVEDEEDIKYINCSENELKAIHQQIKELGWLDA